MRALHAPTALLCASVGLLLVSCQRPAESSAAACIDPSKVDPQGICTMEYNPVCGCDGRTYANPCAAGHAGVRTFTAGPCATGQPKNPADH